MRVEIRLFGGFEVLVDGVRVPDDSWRRRHPAALVKLLALSRGHRLPREQVIDAIWPDLLVEQAAPRLHKAAHFARTALGNRDSVVLSGELVSLFPQAEVSVDVDRFDEAVEAARSDGGSRAASEAIEIYRGDLLPDDLYEPWAEQAREHRRLTYLELLRTLGRWDILVTADPVDEQAHLRLVHEHIRRGDQRAALRQLDWMDKVLRRELGVEPGHESLSLREEVLAMSVPETPGRPRVSAASRVPRPPTPTIGRDRDIEFVLDLLERSHIVTLLGPGGVGKTRLAAEVALRRSETTGVDACFVDLTKVSDADLVPELILREIGIPLESAANVEQLLEEALRGRSLLVVLDNFEHVTDAAGIVGRMVQWSPDIHVLATSRARLHIAGEQVFDVAGLSLWTDPVAPTSDTSPGDAVTLFVQAATAADPNFALAKNFADVVNICRSVDGLPLAIELAAGHVRTLPPSLLLTRLSARLGSPTGAARDLPTRQRTIPATIDWSLQLLGSGEQTLFRQLGVFAGAVPLDAVEQVCGEPGSDIVGALSRLVDHSLVRRVTGPRDEPRYMLLELLRERARDLLTGEEELTVGQRHAEYVAAMLDDLDERRWVAAADRWIDIITELLTEIRAAHAWAERQDDVPLAARITAGMGTYWHREGHHAEGRRWVAGALAHAGDLDDYLVARLELAAGFVEWPRDQLVARNHWAESIRRFRELGHDRYLAYSLAMSAATYIGETDSYDFSIQLCNEGIDLARQVVERPLLAQALNVKGELARVNGDDALARVAYDEGLALASAAHDQTHVCTFLSNLSFLAEHRGDDAEARRLATDALRLSWSIGRRLMTAYTLSKCAGAELALGRRERAARLIGAADEALRILGVNLHPGDRSEYERVVKTLRDTLGEDTYLALQTAGAQLSLGQAVAFALSDDAG